MSTKVFCDVCKKEIINPSDNVGRYGYRVEANHFAASVTVYKDDEENDGDLCLDCLLKMLNQKPKRKYVRKEKVEPVTIITPELHEMEDGLNSEGLTLLKPTKKKRGKVSPVESEIADKKGDNLTIHVPTGLGDDTEYKVNIAGFETTGATLRVTVLAVLEDKFDGKIPDCLSEQERKTIQGILDAGK